ncbi:bifunctional 2-polyprenyl-6-hydroxyphenol methylase/3-demethylubiquinol 3-O-methyltransferase UbiG [Halobacillus sp. BBL2006]|uniref:class I SAM-dependent methyltransferase n=1 Tax=Halobacillus sp. BBL2006 TaxID=1543706 RepID=UPI000542B610|nr:class I SAM-dependent methyltransferase [Halobacillus sp. BBL2006]KHE72582.1 SAM-dependent methyltransferase [Halobacillus sp. BBL2006]
MLEDTGERVIPKEMDPTNSLLLEHIARYTFSTPYVKGRVLDLACGTGYGSAMVAKEKKKDIEEIIGIDICSETIKYAIQNYYHPLLTFKQGNVMNPSLKNEIGVFDTILCFETIEHVKDDRAFMERMYELLKPDGTLILSTPFGKGRDYPCGSPFHYFQLSKKEFQELFTSFSEVEIFYQRGVTIEPPREDVYYPLGVAVCRK